VFQRILPPPINFPCPATFIFFPSPPSSPPCGSQPLSSSTQRGHILPSKTPSPSLSPQPDIPLSPPFPYRRVPLFTDLSVLSFSSLPFVSRGPYFEDPLSPPSGFLFENPQKFRIPLFARIFSENPPPPFISLPVRLSPPGAVAPPTSPPPPFSLSSPTRTFSFFFPQDLPPSPPPAFPNFQCPVISQSFFSPHSSTQTFFCLARPLFCFRPPLQPFCSHAFFSKWNRVDSYSPDRVPKRAGPPVLFLLPLFPFSPTQSCPGNIKFLERILLFTLSQPSLPPWEFPPSLLLRLQFKDLRRFLDDLTDPPRGAHFHSKNFPKEQCISACPPVFV